MDEKPVPDLLRDLSCSRRQFFRDQRKALKMLANLLREKLPQQAPAEPEDRLAVEAHRILDQDEKVDLHQIVASVKQLVAHLAKEHGVEIDLDSGPPLPAVRASRTLLRQVFLTVLSRLIVLPGARRIRLEVQQVRQRVLVEWLVAADQPGSTPEDLSAALAVVPHLLGIVGGNWLGVETGPIGYACRFDFPADGQRVLLVIEDNEGMIRAFCRQLSGYNYMVVGATTGAQALRLARELAPLAITLDVMMPSEDGWDILQKLKGDPATRPIPVIMCSVLQNPDLARSLGAEAYLCKPISQASLLAILDRLSGVR